MEYMIYNDKDYVVAIDFDNTITLNSTKNKTGELNPIAAIYIKKLKKMGCKLVLWTSRFGEALEEAIDLLKKWDLQFDYINDFPERPHGIKIDVDFYIDDKSYTTDIDWDNIIKYIQNKIKEK